MYWCFVGMIIIVSIAVSCVKSTLMKAVSVMMIHLTDYAPLTGEDDKEDKSIDVPGTDS